jgi:ABC-2 type transport system permease protein
VAVAAYGLVWFALAVLVASFGRPSATNAIVLASTWLALVMLVPSLLDLGASTAYPVPSRVEMIQAMRAASDDANQQGAALLARYYDDHPELAVDSADRAMNDFYAIRVAVTADVESRVRPVLERFERQLQAQRRVVSRLRVLSPAIPMQDALNDLAGTSVARHQHFVGQVAQFHAGWRSHFVPMILRRSQLSGYATLPRFAYTDEPMSDVLARVTASIAWMLLPAGLLAIAGLRRLRRFSVA